jgi:hypothetical protein
MLRLVPDSNALLWLLVVRMFLVLPLACAFSRSNCSEADVSKSEVGWAEPRRDALVLPAGAPDSGENKAREVDGIVYSCAQQLLAVPAEQIFNSKPN